ncbi:hypothetical protein C4D60_Mb10t01340 [Musa balbisiana]|uniref:Uncharacterized protein n=1 Tax=Musa balbisiana TaxID=52838 RepID=A0A4V4H4I4_MUSBA|nr:hypothetical protein C4D60_Mb10t01340 [Musa balbisiana]
MARTRHHRRITAVGHDGSITAALFLLALLPRFNFEPTPTPPSPSTYYSGRNNPTSFSHSTATLVIVLISALIFVSFFSGYLRQCAGVAAADDARGNISGAERGPPQ